MSTTQSQGSARFRCDFGWGWGIRRRRDVDVGIVLFLSRADRHASDGAPRRYGSGRIVRCGRNHCASRGAGAMPAQSTKKGGRGAFLSTVKVAVVEVDVLIVECAQASNVLSPSTRHFFCACIIPGARRASEKCFIAARPALNVPPQNRMT